MQRSVKNSNTFSRILMDNLCTRKVTNGLKIVLRCLYHLWFLLSMCYISYLLLHNKLLQNLVIKATIIRYHLCSFWGQEFGSSLIGGSGSGSPMKPSEDVSQGCSLWRLAWGWRIDFPGGPSKPELSSSGSRDKPCVKSWPTETCTE